MVLCMQSHFDKTVHVRFFSQYEVSITLSSCSHKTWIWDSPQSTADYWTAQCWGCNNFLLLRAHQTNRLAFILSGMTLCKLQFIYDIPQHVIRYHNSFINHSALRKCRNAVLWLGTSKSKWYIHLTSTKHQTETSIKCKLVVYHMSFSMFSLFWFN